MKMSESFPTADLKVAELDEATTRRAALAVCSMAANKTEARQVLEALGLVAPIKPAQPTGRSRHRGRYRPESTATESYYSGLRVSDLTYMQENGYLRESPS